jgi:hypothetical protein
MERHTNPPSVRDTAASARESAREAERLEDHEAREAREAKPLPFVAHAAPAAHKPDAPVPDPIPKVPPGRSALKEPLPVAMPDIIPAPTSAHGTPNFPPPAPPSLVQAFLGVCAALEPHLRDNAPAHAHLAMVETWYSANPVNQRVAWGHLMALLEGILDGPLTHG